MNLARRRAFLEGIAESAESDAVRLRALDLLERLDERESERMPSRPSAAELSDEFAERLADDPERLDRVAELYLASGLLTPLIEERARELAVEMTRQHSADRGTSSGPC